MSGISEKHKSRQLREADVPIEQQEKSKTYRQVQNILEVETIYNSIGTTC